METLNNGTASLPLTPALQHPRQQALRRELVIVPGGYSTPLALSLDEVVSLNSFHTCRESFKTRSRRASLVTNASLATCNSDQTAVFSCHSSRAGSIDRGYHDIDEYDDDGNRRFDERRFGVREDYAGDGYWSPAPTCGREEEERVAAEADHDLERNSSLSSTVYSAGSGSRSNRWRERVGGRAVLPSPTTMLRWVRSRAQREDEDAERRQRDGKSEQSLDKRSRRILFSLALLAVFLFTTSDTCLHASNHFVKAAGSGEQNRWVAVALRSVVQLVVSASIAAGTKNCPWGPVRAWPRLLVIAVLTGSAVFTMDYSYRHSTDRLSSFSCFMLLPLATFIATMTMALFCKCASPRTGEWSERESFTVHRVISVLCLAFAALLFTQPQLLHLASEAPPAKPSFGLDPAFAWPLDVLGYDDSASSESRLNVGVILSHLAVPVLLAFLYVFVFICKDVHLSVVSFWISVGGGVTSIYGLFTSEAFHNYAFPTDPSYIVLLSLSALFGTLGVLALIRFNQATNPNRTVLLRSLQLVLVYVLQLCFGTKNLHLYDIFAVGLVLISTLHVTMELVFF